MPWPSVNVIGCARAALRPVDISLEMLDLRCWILPREILVFIGTAGTDLVTTAPFIFFYTWSTALQTRCRHTMCTHAILLKTTQHFPFLHFPSTTSTHEHQTHTSRIMLLCYWASRHWATLGLHSYAQMSASREFHPRIPHSMLSMLAQMSGS